MNYQVGPYFTSDTHFQHRMCATKMRGFASVEEHDEALITAWNSVIGQKDLVYHLGDVALGDKQGARKILDRLNGRIYLVRGNHDSVAEHAVCRDRFEWIKDMHYLSLVDGIVLCHYAMLTWNKSHYGSWQLYGHSHNSLHHDGNRRSMDVGVDCNNWKPFSLLEITAVMKTRKFKPIDHHDPALLTRDYTEVG